MTLVRFPPTIRRPTRYRMLPESDATPTHPGWYWFQPETIARALSVEVRMTKGTLTVWWPTQDKPVGHLNGCWHGPISPLSFGPGRQ